ncbi:hypothetical protein ACFLX3_03380 [Chloroflexota bacterium]
MKKPDSLYPQVTMAGYTLTEGRGRTRVSLLAEAMGNDQIVLIYNENAHIGAVALGEYDFEHERASVSVITRLGHKDDAIAQQAAYLISKQLKKPVCVIAGVHLDDITGAEISQFLKNSHRAVEKFIKSKSGASV